MKSLFRRARSVPDLQPKYVPSPLTSLPEDVLIAVLGYVDVPDLIRLRRVNKSFRDLTKSLIVWVHALQRFPLILHHHPDVTTAQEIEHALVFSSRLDEKLSSTKPSTRSGWTLPEAVGGELWTPSMSIAGDYLAVSGSENGFLCVNLVTKMSWNIAVPTYPTAHWVTAAEMTLKGQRGIVMVGRGVERTREAMVYFQPLPELPNDDRAHELIRIGMHDKISCAELCGSSVLVGSASGEITRVDLEHMITQKYSIGGLVWDLAIYEQFLVICHSGTGSRITIRVLSPLDDITDASSDSSSNQMTAILSTSLNSSSREVFAVSLPKHPFPGPSTTNPVIRIFTHSLPLVNLAHSLIIPYRDRTGRVDAVYSNIPGMAFSSVGFSRGSLWSVSCARAGHSRAISLISVRTGNVNNQELILSNVQDVSSIVHRRVNIHSKKLAESLLGRGGELAWDEPSGRLCVCTRRSRQKCIITVLEF